MNIIATSYLLSVMQVSLPSLSLGQDFFEFGVCLGGFVGMPICRRIIIVNCFSFNTKVFIFHEEGL